MNKYSPKLEIFNKNPILFTLKILILLIPLYAYKYVYEFRINQKMILIFFTVAALTFWIINIILKEEYTWYSDKINIPTYLFILVMTISLFRTNYFYPGFNDYLIFLAYFILYFLIINNIKNESGFDLFLKLFFVTSTLISIYTILHYYGLIPYLREFGPVVSLIGQKNWTSNYIGLIFPLIFSFFLIEEIRKIKIIYFIILSISYITLMICQSRGIWISISLTLMLAIYIIIKFKLFEIFKKNKKWLIVLLSTFLIITLIYSTDNPLNRSALTVPQRALSTFDEQDPSINTRLLIWKTTFEMIKDRPILGSGIGSFKMNYLDYQAEFLKDNSYYIKYSGKAGEAHNEYLQIGAELGIIGLGLFLAIIFIFYNLAVNFLKKETFTSQGIIKKDEDIIVRSKSKDEIVSGDRDGLAMTKMSRCYGEEGQSDKVNSNEGISHYILNEKLGVFSNKKSVKKRIIVFGLLMGITCFLIHSMFTFPLHVPALGSAFFILLGLTVVYVGEFDLNKINKKKSIWGKINLRKLARTRIIFIILIFICLVFVIDFLVIKPYVAEIYYFKGMRYNADSNYNKALPNFEYAAQLYPYNGRIIHALGSTYYNLKICDKAEETLQRAKNYINDRNTFRSLGLSYMQSGRYEEAEKELKHAIYLDPKFINAYVDLAYLYAKQKEYDKAIVEWNKILEIDPDFYEKYNVLYFMGLTYKKKEMPEKALEYFAQALQLVPDGSPINEEIEEEIYKIYRGNLNN